MEQSRTSTSFYRRVYVAYLIDTGVDTVPKLMQETNMPRRTAQDTISALGDIGIQCQFNGERKNGTYIINSWGLIDKDVLDLEAQKIKFFLGY